MLHSISDIFLQITKTLHRMGRLNGVGYLAFIGTLLSWFYLRCLGLPAICLLFKNDLIFPPQMGDLVAFKPSVLVFLYTLVGMHYFWFSLILGAAL